MVVFWKKWLFSGTWLYSVKSACIWAKLLYSGEMVFLGQKWL